jgi:hypothetical protein
MLVNNKDILKLFSEKLDSSDFNFDVQDPVLKPPSYLLELNTDENILIHIPKNIGNMDLSLENLFKLFGTNRDQNLPSFYNQDWFINEDFFKQPIKGSRWVLVDKSITEVSRGTQPSSQASNDLFSAVEYTFIFFVMFIKYELVLCEFDYIWTRDRDLHGDQIYVGRYTDKSGMSQDGFSIHRHLSIKNNYGVLNGRGS